MCSVSTQVSDHHRNPCCATAGPVTHGRPCNTESSVYVCACVLLSVHEESKAFKGAHYQVG